MIWSMSRDRSGDQTESEFATAPRWLRPILRTERAVIERVYSRRRQRASQQMSEDALGGPDNVKPTIVGGLIPERLSPGRAPGESFAQHVERYSWALPRVDGARVIELGCGLGYGCELLSWSAASVTGVDIDEEAVSLARARYPAGTYRVADVTGDLGELGDADVAVCFEVIEHVADPEVLLERALRIAPRLLLSMPNPLIGGTHLNPHHRNDWPPTTLWRALHRAGATRTRWYRQGVQSARVRRGAFPTSGVWLVDARR